jgi:hypothetical protein
MEWQKQKVILMVLIYQKDAEDIENNLEGNYSLLSHIVSI